MDGSLSRGAGTIAAQAGQTVHLPGSLSEASLTRSGDDLIVVGAGGERIVVHGYFLLTPPPSLTGDAGEVFDGDLVARLAGPMAPGQYAQAGDPANAASTVVGRVDKAEGEVSVQHADGTHGHLKAGDPLYEGDLIRTAPGSSVGVTLLDGSAVSLGELARLVLSDVAYNSDSHQGDMKLDLVAGPLSFVSGEIAKTAPDAFQIHTPTTTIGIRGTAGGVTVSPTGETSAVLIPETGGSSGEMTVGGVVLNQPLQSVTISGASQPPSPPVTLTPSQVGQQYGSALASLPRAGGSIESSTLQQVIQSHTEQQQQQQQQQEQQQQQQQPTGGQSGGAPATTPASTASPTQSISATVAALVAQIVATVQADIAAAVVAQTVTTTTTTTTVITTTTTTPTTTTTTTSTTLPAMTRWQLQEISQSGTDLVVTYDTSAGVETVVHLTGALASSSVASTTLTSVSGETMSLVGAAGGVAPATLSGTSGNDIIVGTLGSATLVSGGGSDLFYVADLGSGHSQTVIGNLNDSDGDGYPGGGEVDFSGLDSPITMAYAPSVEVISTPTAVPLGAVVLGNGFTLWTLNDSVWARAFYGSDAPATVLLSDVTHATVIPVSGFGAVIAALGSDGSLTLTPYDATGIALVAGTTVTVDLNGAQIDAVGYCRFPASEHFGVVINGSESTQVQIFEISATTPVLQTTLSFGHAAGDGAAHAVGTSDDGLFVAWATQSGDLVYHFYAPGFGSFETGTIPLGGTLADATLVSAQALDDGGAMVAWVTTDDTLHLSILPDADSAPITTTLPDISCADSVDNLQTLTLLNGYVVVSWIEDTTLKAVLIDPVNGERLGSTFDVVTGLSGDTDYSLVATGGASFAVETANDDGSAIVMNMVTCVTSGRILVDEGTSDHTLVAQVSDATGITCSVHVDGDNHFSVDLLDANGDVVGTSIPLNDVASSDKVAVCSFGSLGFSVQWIDNDNLLHVTVIGDDGTVTGPFISSSNVAVDPGTLHSLTLSAESSLLLISFDYEGTPTLATLTLSGTDNSATVATVGISSHLDSGASTALSLGENGTQAVWIEDAGDHASLVVKLFNADGSLAGTQPASPILYDFAVPNLTFSDLKSAALPDGSTLLTWIESITTVISEGNPITSYALRAVQFDSSGLRGEVQTLQSLTDSESSYSLITRADGSIQINLFDNGEETYTVYTQGYGAPDWHSSTDTETTVTTEYADIGLVTLVSGVVYSVFMIDGVAMAQRLDAAGEAVGSPVVLAEGLPTGEGAVSLTQLGASGFAVQWVDSSHALHVVPVTLSGSGIHAGAATTVDDVSFTTASLQTVLHYTSQGTVDGLVALSSSMSADGGNVTVVQLTLAGGTFSEGTPTDFNVYSGTSEVTPLGLSNGNILVAWDNNTSISYRLFTGTSWTEPFFLGWVNATEGDGTLSLTALSGGRAMISWVSSTVTEWGEGESTTNYWVSLATINADGSSNSIRYLTSSTGNQISNLQTTQLVDGALLLTWVEGTGAVHGRLVSSSGDIIGNELDFSAVIGTVHDAAYSVAAQSDGSFLIEWGDSTGAIHTSRFDSAGSPVEIATSGSGATYTLFGLDTIVGTNFDDVLYGTANQTLIGGAGNDTLHGVAGTMVSYAYDPAGVTVDLTSNRGYDGYSTSVFDYDTLIGITAVKGSRFADTLRAGNNLDTVYTLVGGGGADTLYGSEGDVTFVVDPTQGVTATGGNRESTLILDYSDESTVPATINLSMLADGHYTRIDNIALYSSDGPRVIEVNEESLSSFYDHNSVNNEDQLIGIEGNSTNTVSLTGGDWTNVVDPSGYFGYVGATTLIDSGDLGISIRDGITLSFGADTTFEGGNSFSPGGDLINAGTIDVVGSYHYVNAEETYVQNVHGSLTIEGDVTLADSSVLSLDWDDGSRDNSGKSDSLTVDGDLTLGGTLDLDMHQTWTSGATMDLISAKNIDGHFDHISGLYDTDGTIDWLLDLSLATDSESGSDTFSAQVVTNFSVANDENIASGKDVVGVEGQDCVLHLTANSGVAIGNSGDDRITFSVTGSGALDVDYIDGGGGTNTLDLSGNGTIDLTANALYALKNIQEIFLEHQATLTLDADNVLAMLNGGVNSLIGSNAQNILVIGGDETTQVTNLGNAGSGAYWELSGSTTITGDSQTSYQVYSHTENNQTASIAVNTHFPATC